MDHCDSGGFLVVRLPRLLVVSSWLYTVGRSRHHRQCSSLIGQDVEGRQIDIQAVELVDDDLVLDTVDQEMYRTMILLKPGIDTRLLVQYMRYMPSSDASRARGDGVGWIRLKRIGVVAVRWLPSVQQYMTEKWQRCYGARLLGQY